MSVLIRMKLPPNCRECDIEYDSYYCPLAGKETGDDRYGKRLDDCPIIAELPEKHGRLVDADKLMAIFSDRLEKVAERYGIDSSEAGILSGAMKLLESQTAIIEAEGSEGAEE